MLLALVSAAFASEAGAVAGRTEFTIGGVTIARNGVERPLTRGTELDNGDVVRTNDGRAQIRFTDGAYVSLQPYTDFAIRDYRFENKTDGSERGFFGLVKGAMRTVTGLIGRVNRDRYQIVTPTATVGIRGTGGVIQVLQDGSTLVIGTSGIWSLTNPAGSIDVPAGVSGLSPTDPDEPPSQTTTQPTSSPAPLPPQEPVFVQGNEVDSSGSALIEQAFTPLVSGDGYAAAGAWTSSELGAELGGGEGDLGSAVFSAGQLTEYRPGTDLYRLEPGGTHADFGTDGGVLAWGRWIGPVTVTDIQGFQSSENYSENKGFHYVIGMPTTDMPTNATATYSMIGFTRPTLESGGSAPGSFDGRLTVDFFSGLTEVRGDFDVAVGGNAYSWTSFGQTSTSQFSMFTSSVTGCSSVCSADVRGFFSGAAASHAGISYKVEDGSDPIIGAAAFKRGALGPAPLPR